MIRIVVENVLLFLLPTGIYLIYAVAQRRGQKPSGSSAGVIDDAPLLWLFVAGAMTVIVTLAAFGSNTGGKPGVAYEPPSLQNGRVVPGHPTASGKPAPPREDAAPRDDRK